MRDEKRFTDARKEAMDKPDRDEDEQSLLEAFDNGEFRSELDEERRRSLANSAETTLAGK